MWLNISSLFILAGISYIYITINPLYKSLIIIQMNIGFNKILIMLCIFRTLQAQPPETVDSVDLNLYKGRWYDIASYPAWFQKDCNCTIAEYEIVPGKNYFRVINRCVKFRNGKSRISVARGKVFIVKGSGNAKLKVQFFWPFRGDYHIIGYQMIIPGLSLDTLTGSTSGSFVDSPP